MAWCYELGQLAVLCYLVYLVRDFCYTQYDRQKNQQRECERQRDQQQRRCLRIAQLIAQGEDIRRKCLLTEPVPTGEIKAWLKSVRTYLYDTYGYAAIVQWETEIDFHPSTLPSGVPGINQRMHDVLSHRLYQLHYCLNKLIQY